MCVSVCPVMEWRPAQDIFSASLRPICTGDRYQQMSLTPQSEGDNGWMFGLFCSRGR